MSDVRFTVRAIINPTEDPDKVKRAIKKLFPTVEPELEEGSDSPVLVGKAKGRKALVALREKFRSRLVNDAVRAALLRERRGRRTTLYLNRQAAYVGKAYLAELGEEPLGPIEVVIESDDIDGFIEWFTAY